MGAEQPAADVIVPRISAWRVLFLLPVPSVSFSTEGSKRKSIKTLALCHLTVVSGKVLGNRFPCRECSLAISSFGTGSLFLSLKLQL